MCTTGAQIRYIINSNSVCQNVELKEAEESESEIDYSGDVSQSNCV